jgi:hypothetical protein
MSAIKTRIDRNLQQVRQGVAEACARRGRNPADVNIIAVTKSADMDAVKALLDLGVVDLGESKVQDLTDRAAEVAQYLSHRRGGQAVRWHMIGHLQRNKVRPVLEVAQVIHSIDSLRLAEEINARAEKDARVVEVLLQVNSSGEAQKFGVAVGAAMHMGELIGTLKHLRLVGLMTMAAQSSRSEDARAPFARLREVFEEMRHEKVGGDHFRHLSMGMSDDYPVAVEEGATLLRIGSALFK